MDHGIGTSAVGPDYSLKEFARTQLASTEEWEDFCRVHDAPLPETRTRLVDGVPTPETDQPSPDFVLRLRLSTELIRRLKECLTSGEWVVRAMRQGQSDRERVAIDLLLQSPRVSFMDDRIGPFFLVQLIPAPGEDRFDSIKWFIEQICQVVPPKMGMGRPQVQDLAERLLKFDVRDDIFKAAWSAADKPAGWSKPGPKG